MILLLSTFSTWTGGVAFIGIVAGAFAARGRP